MGETGNDFLDQYFAVRQQRLAEDQQRRAAEAHRQQMADAIEAMQARRQARQVADLDTALKVETDRAQAGLEETPGPPRPGDVAVFKNQERTPVDYGDLPRGFDPSEIARIADVRAKRLESDRIRKQQGEDIDRDLKTQRETRELGTAKAREDYLRASAERARRPPAQKVPTATWGKSWQRAFNVMHANALAEAAAGLGTGVIDDGKLNALAEQYDAAEQAKRATAVADVPPLLRRPDGSGDAAPKKPKLITTESEYRALAPGTAYIAPDGQIHYKPK